MIVRVPVFGALGCMAFALAGPAAAQVAPAGAVIDLGTGTPPTVNMYTQYSATVTAQSTGLYYTLFAFREDPAYFRFDDASLTAVTAAASALPQAASANLLTNPGFEGGTTPNSQNSSYVVPDGWGVVYQTGSVPAAAGTVDAGGRDGGGTPHSGAAVWDDGSVGSFDGIYQTFNAVAGQQYLMSFYLSADDPFVSGADGNSGVEMAAYFGACSSADSCSTVLGGFTVQQPSAPTIATTGGDIAPNIFSLGSPAAMASTVTFEGGTLQMTGGNFPDNIISAPVDITASNGTVDTSTGSGGFSGVVSGPGSLTIIGSNTFSLTNANTYAGGTVLSGGTLLVGNDAALGTGPLTFAGGVLSPNASGYALANAAVLSSAGTIDTGGFDLTYAGAISGAGQLVKAGSGTLALSGANTYAGGTLLSAGTIVVSNATVQNGATTASSIGTGTLTFDGGTLRNGSTAAGGLTFGNAVAVNAAGGTIDANSNNLTFLAPITDGQGVGTLTFANTGGASAGVVSLGASSTFSGQAVIASPAFVILDADNAIGRGNVEVEGLLELGTSSQAIARLTGAGAIIDNRGFGPGTGTVDTLTVQSGSFGGTIEENDGLPIAIVKASDGTASGGTLVLAGTTLNTGPTTVAAAPCRRAPRQPSARTARCR